MTGDLKKSLTSIFQANRLPDSDNLYDRIIEAINKYGIEGLKSFEDDISPKQFKTILSSIKNLSLNDDDTVESIYDFKSYIKNFLLKYRINNDKNDLQSIIIKFFIDKLIESFKMYQNEIKFEKFKKSFKTNSFRESKACKKMKDFLKLYFKDLNLTSNENLISKMTDTALICLLEVLNNFNEEIPENTMEEISNVIDLQIENTTSSRNFKNNTKTDGNNEKNHNTKDNNYMTEPNKAKEDSSVKVDLAYVYDLRNRFMEMPICLERSIISLIFYVNLKIADQITLIEEFKKCLDTWDSQVEREINILKERLKIEQADNEDLKYLYHNICSKIEAKDFSSQLIIELERLLKKIRPLDIYEMSFLIQKANKAAALIKDQDIILLIGNTGAGKSTTIQFLAGSKMSKQRIEIKPGKFLDHVSGETNTIPALKNVISSYLAKSETRYINPVQINLKDIGGRDDRTVIVCDTPGLGDTAGAEVDIANGIGIIEAIKECKSVRPVFLFSYLSLGNNGEGIRELAHFLVNMVNNIEDNLCTFTFIFTKFPPEVNINATLLNIRNAVMQNPNENSDVSFKAIIEDMLDKTETEDDAAPLDPINDKPIYIIKKIEKSRSIKNPKITFKFSITEESKLVINEQKRLHQLSIIKAIEREEYRLVKYKLNELIVLKDNLKDDHTGQIFKDCINAFLNHVNDAYTSTKDLFNSFLDRKNCLSLKDVEKYRQKVDKFKELICLDSIESLKGRVDRSGALLINLNSKIEEIVKDIKYEDNDFTCQNNINTIFNVKLIASYFPEVALKYETLKEMFLKKAEELAEKVDHHLEQNEFNELASLVNIIIKAQTPYNEHFKLDIIKDRALNKILNFFNDISARAKNIFTKIQITENDVKNVKDCIEILEKAKTTDRLHEFLNKGEISDIYESLITHASAYFESLIVKAKEILSEKTSNTFKEMENLVKKMNNIRSIPIIEFRTSEGFHSTIQNMLGIMQQVERETLQFFENLKNNENVDYDKIYTNLRFLKDAEWINAHKQGNYDEIINNIKTKIVDNLLKVQESILELDLDLSNYKNLEVANQYVLKFKSIREIEKSMPEVKDLKENSLKIFNEAINRTFKYIKETFNLQNHSKNKLNDKLESLKAMKTEYGLLHPKYIFLKKIHLNSLEEIGKEIKTKEQAIDQLKSKISRLMSRQNELNFFSDELSQLRNAIERKKLLFQNGFDDSNHFDKVRLEIENEIKDSNASIEKIKKEELKTLISYEIEFKKLQSSEDISDEQKEFIFKTRYKSIENLNNEIKTIENEMKNLKDKGHDYIFNRIDLLTAENSLNYVQACCAIKDIKEQSILAKTDLENYFKAYNKYIEDEVKSLLNEIIGLKFDSTSRAFGIAHRLKNFVTELTDIEVYNLLNKIINRRDILDHLVTSLNQQLIGLSDQLNNDKTNQIDLRYKLEIVKALIQLDSLVGGKFFKLYQEYQAVATKEFKEFYKKIIEYIEKYDFQNVTTELMSCDDNPVNQNAFSHIKRLLSSAINELLEKTKSIAIIMPNTLPNVEIQYLTENLRKLESAKKHVCADFDENDKKKFKSDGYIDPETKEKLKTRVEEVEDIMSSKLMRYLHSIEALISINDFSEAEEQREHLNNIRFILGSYCRKDEIEMKIAQIQRDLENIVNTVKIKYAEIPLHDYIFNPPSQIIEKLGKVAGRNLNYSLTLKEIQRTVLGKLRDTLKTAREANINDRNAQIQIIKGILGSVPFEIKAIIESEIVNFEQSLKDKEEEYKREYENLGNIFDVNTVITFMKKCEENGMKSILRSVRDDIVTKSCECKEKISKNLSEDDIKHVILNFQKLREYKVAFGGQIMQIEGFHSQAEKQLISRYKNIITVLSNISSNENTDSIINCFNEFKEFMKLIVNKVTDQTLDIIIQDNTELIRSIISRFFMNFHDKYFYSTLEFDFESFIASLNGLKKWNTLLIQFNNFNKTFELKSTVTISIVKDYNETREQATTFLQDLKIKIKDFELQKGYTKETEIFYEIYFKKLNFLKLSKQLKDHIYNTAVYDVASYEKEILPFVKEKFQTVINAAKNILENDSLTKYDLNDFRINILNLTSLEKNSRLIDLDFKNNLDEINSILNNRIDVLQTISMNADCTIPDLTKALKNLKLFATNLPEFNEGINQKIDKVLENYSINNKAQKGLAMAKLSTELENDPEGIGLEIITEHKIFKGQSISLFNQSTQRHDIEYVLRNLEGNDIDKQLLLESFTLFDKTYKSLVKSYISKFERSDKHTDKNKILGELVRNIKSMLEKMRINKIKKKSYEWDANGRDKIIELVANILALWTLKNTDYFEQMKGVDETERNNFLLTPHPGQIISILRLLGIGYINSNKMLNFLQNNLIQVGTGEGKSLILAVASCALVLLGAEVSCVCFSEYLSTRDFESFKSIFEALDITKNIHYGTFNRICENILNEQGDIRSRVVNLIFSKKEESIKSDLDETQARVLLIDEVDVFFSVSFYGSIYTPLARLVDPSINNLTNYLWNNRNNRLDIAAIEKIPEFQACCARFIGWEFLIKEAVKDMIADLKDYKHEYLIQDDRIAYKEQDGISFDVVYGYKTMFSYYFEKEMGKISEASLNNNISIGIKCGSFSYAEIPHSFDFIMGVTGTLKTLSTAERSIVEDIYNIKKNTYMPSVFGANKRQFAEEADVLIENKDDYFNRLREQIDKNKGKTAVLVFFDTKTLLNEFYNSDNIAPIKNEVQVITEEISSTSKEKEMFIKRAATCGQITFLTKVFGRGTDFVCRDQNTISSCGIHIIQTFFSEELSEEIQIMGRTARQGKDGSYSMILLNSDLEKYLGVYYLIQIADMKKNRTTYEVLNKKRNELFNKKYASMNDSVKEAKEEHELGRKFIKYLNEKNVESIKKFLGERNKGVTVIGESRTICLMDATGSMGRLLNQAKNTVATMFERASAILTDNGIPPDSFQLQFAVYRDYDCEAEKLLQISPWETKPDSLRSFMEKITPSGGGDYPEAIEIGLWHANQEANSKAGLSQVILIGDAPAKSEAAIKKDRMIYHKESYWSGTKFKETTFYKNEVEKLKNKKIPIHAFYLHNGAKDNFKEISSETGGRFEFLDIDSKIGSELLANVVTEEILRSVGSKSGKGDELVNAYKKKFNKAYA